MTWGLGMLAVLLAGVSVGATRRALRRPAGPRRKGRVVKTERQAYEAYRAGEISRAEWSALMLAEFPTHEGVAL